MPYKMPDNCIEDMKKSILKEILNDTAMQRRNHNFNLGTIFRTAVASAAAITLFIISANIMQQKPASKYYDVEKAFDNLSYDDQNFMIETYNDDVFLASGEYTDL